MSASAFTPEQRARIMREVLEDHISPGDLSKKYNISAHSIRDWIKKAGHQLPKSYKRFFQHLQQNLVSRNNGLRLLFPCKA